MTDYQRPIEPGDEASHEPEGAGGWRENWWLCFFDHARGIRGIAYAGVQPLIGRAFVLVGIFRDDRPLYVLDDDKLGEGDYDHRTGRVGPVTFTCQEPMQSWRVDLVTPVATGSLQWTAAHEAYDWRWGEGTQSRHYEQPGRVAGRLTIGDETYEIDGWGQRDRAWGHRPVHAIRAAWSSRVLFGEDDLQHAAIINAKDSTYLFGYRCKDGRRMTIDRLRLAPSFAYHGGPPISTELLAWSGDELIADQQVRLANVIPRLSVGGGSEAHQFFTFSEFYEGSAACVGQLDHWWSVPRVVTDVIEATGNDGVWVGA